MITTMGEAPRISVVIATYRRPELLARCLNALWAQTLAPDAFEVIVVDDGQTEDTRQLVESVAARHGGAARLRYLRPQGTRGPAAARNRGWRAARAPLIAFTDDDTLPDPGWLEAGERAMAGREVAVCGRVVVPISDRPTDHELVTKGLEDAEFVTANAFVRREALERIGGFDERFLRAWREDSDLQFRLLHCGPVGRAPGAVVVHPARAVPWGVSLRQQKNSLYEALLYKKHPHLYRARIQPRTPWRYYGIVLGSGAAVVAALAGQGALAFGCASLSLALITRFARQRLRRTRRTPAHVGEMLATSALIPFLSVWWRLAGAWRFRVLFL